jgi:signal transduction histidine kinase
MFAIVAVADTGRGIEPSFLPFVFDRFRQADSSTSRLYGGLGLGRSLVRHLVELHGGTVGAESADVGRGATFSFELPLASAERTAATLAGVAPGE